MARYGDDIFPTFREYFTATGMISSIPSLKGGSFIYGQIKGLYLPYLRLRGVLHLWPSIRAISSLPSPSKSPSFMARYEDDIFPTFSFKESFIYGQVGGRYLSNLLIRGVLYLWPGEGTKSSLQSPSGSPSFMGR